MKIRNNKSVDYHLAVIGCVVMTILLLVPCCVKRTGEIIIDKDLLPAITTFITIGFSKMMWIFRDI